MQTKTLEEQVNTIRCGVQGFTVHHEDAVETPSLHRQNVVLQATQKIVQVVHSGNSNDGTNSLSSPGKKKMYDMLSEHITEHELFDVLVTEHHTPLDIVISETFNVYATTVETILTWIMLRASSEHVDTILRALHKVESLSYEHDWVEDELGMPDNAHDYLQRVLQLYFLSAAYDAVDEVSQQFPGSPWAWVEPLFPEHIVAQLQNHNKERYVAAYDAAMYMIDQELTEESEAFKREMSAPK